MFTPQLQPSWSPRTEGHSNLREFRPLVIVIALGYFIVRPEHRLSPLLEGAALVGGQVFHARELPKMLLFKSNKFLSHPPRWSWRHEVARNLQFAWLWMVHRQLPGEGALREMSAVKGPHPHDEGVRALHGKDGMFHRQLRGSVHGFGWSVRRRRLRVEFV